MSDWFCGRCGKDVYTHSLASSDCVWMPVDSDWLAAHVADLTAEKDARIDLLRDSVKTLIKDRKTLGARLAAAEATIAEALAATKRGNLMTPHWVIDALSAYRPVAAHPTTESEATHD